MIVLFAIFGLTTAIAIVSALFTRHSRLQQRVLTWAAGILLGIGIFWILPEMAEDRGWVETLVGVGGILLLLVLIDRYAYPICPFCAAGMHSRYNGAACAGSARAGWPLLIFACIHTCFDGWTIALSHASAAMNSAPALSWGAAIHKIPESVAIGLLSAQLTSSRRMALGSVALIQLVMAAGGVLAIFAGSRDSRWTEMSAMPACAFLLLFGFLTLEQDWRTNGRAIAMRAAAPGLLGCGLAALASSLLAR
jgi:zinc transporter ZupT